VAAAAAAKPSNVHPVEQSFNDALLRLAREFEALHTERKDVAGRIRAANEYADREWFDKRGLAEAVLTTENMLRDVAQLEQEKRSLDPQAERLAEAFKEWRTTRVPYAQGLLDPQTTAKWEAEHKKLPLDSHCVQIWDSIQTHNKELDTSVEDLRVHIRSLQQEVNARTTRVASAGTPDIHSVCKIIDNNNRALHRLVQNVAVLESRLAELTEPAKSNRFTTPERQVTPIRVDRGVLSAPRLRLTKSSPSPARRGRIDLAALSSTADDEDDGTKATPAARTVTPAKTIAPRTPASAEAARQH
jgi:prefoldin subunit 5